MVTNLKMAQENEEYALLVFYETSHKARKCDNCGAKKIELDIKKKHCKCAKCARSFHIYDHTLFQGLHTPAHKIIALLVKTLGDNSPMSSFSKKGIELGIDRRTVTRITKKIHPFVNQYKKKQQFSIRTYLNIPEYIFKNLYKALEDTKREIRAAQEIAKAAVYIGFVDAVLSTNSENVQND